MKNFIQKGDFIDVVAIWAVTAGSAYQTSNIVGVATTDAAPGETFSLALSGVYKMPVAALGADVNVGDVLYCDVFTKTVTPSAMSGATGNTRMGHAVAFAPAGATFVYIRLCQMHFPA